MTTRISRHGSKHGLVSVVITTGGWASELYPLCKQSVGIKQQDGTNRPLEEDSYPSDASHSGVDGGEEQSVGSQRSHSSLKEEQLEDDEALVPLGNVPMIYYSLVRLEEIFTQNGMSSVAIVVQGEQEHKKMKQWIDKRYAGQPPTCRPHIVIASEPQSSAASVRDVFDQGLGVEFDCAETIIVLSSNVVTDVQLASVVAEHMLTSATATVMLAHSREDQIQASTALKKTSSSVSNKSTSALDKSTTFIGLDPKHERLCLWVPNDASSANNRRNRHYGQSKGQQLRQLQVPMKILKAVPNLNIFTNLINTEACIFNRSVIDMLANDRNVDSISADLIPLLIKQQFREVSKQDNKERSAVENPNEGEVKYNSGEELEKSPEASVNRKASEAVDEQSSGNGSNELTHAKLQELIEEMSHTYVEDTGFKGKPPKTLCNVFIVPLEKYCAKLNSIETYGDMSKDLASGELSHLLPPNSNCAPPEIGSKSTMGAGCVFGENIRIGDKCSIKRSIIGDRCKIGSNVKIVNSVLMEDTCIEDGSHIQNCIICKQVTVNEKCTLKDCCVGPQWTVDAGLEHRGETLAQPFNQFL